MVDIRELEKELGLEDALFAEGARLRVHTESRRYGKVVTIVEGFDPAMDLAPLATQLKQKVGAGGTVKGRTIELQGDHRRRATDLLKERGFTVA